MNRLSRAGESSDCYTLILTVSYYANPSANIIQPFILLRDLIQIISPYGIWRFVSGFPRSHHWNRFWPVYHITTCLFKIRCNIFFQFLPRCISYVFRCLGRDEWARIAHSVQSLGYGLDYQGIVTQVPEKERNSFLVQNIQPGCQHSPPYTAELQLRTFFSSAVYGGGCWHPSWMFWTRKVFLYISGSSTHSSAQQCMEVGAGIRAGCFERGKYFFPFPAIEWRFPGSPAPSLVTALSALSVLIHHHLHFYTFVGDNFTFSCPFRSKPKNLSK